MRRIVCSMLLLGAALSTGCYHRTKAVPVLVRKQCFEVPANQWAPEKDDRGVYGRRKIAHRGHEFYVVHMPQTGGSIENYLSWYHEGKLSTPTRFGSRARRAVQACRLTDRKRDALRIGDVYGAPALRSLFKIARPVHATTYRHRVGLDCDGYVHSLLLDDDGCQLSIRRDDCAGSKDIEVQLTYYGPPDVSPAEHIRRRRSAPNFWPHIAAIVAVEAPRLAKLQAESDARRQRSIEWWNKRRAAIAAERRSTDDMLREAMHNVAANEAEQQRRYRGNEARARGSSSTASAGTSGSAALTPRAETLPAGSSARTSEPAGKSCDTGDRCVSPCFLRIDECNRRCGATSDSGCHASCIYTDGVCGEPPPAIKSGKTINQ